MCNTYSISNYHSWFLLHFSKGPWDFWTWSTVGCCCPLWSLLITPPIAPWLLWPPPAPWPAALVPSAQPRGSRRKLCEARRLEIANKLRWYPQQPQHFIFTNLSEACWEAKRWKHSADFPWVKWTWPGLASAAFSGNFSGTLLNLTWLCTKASRSLLRNLLRNLLQNPVEPDLALHQSLPEPSPQPSPEPSPKPCWTSQAFGTFSGTRWTWLGFAPSLPGTLLNLTSLCAKASRSLLRNLFQNLVDLNHTWLCTKASQTFSGTFSGPVELHLALHQSLPEPSPEPSSEPCWSSAPKPPIADLLRRPSPEPSLEPCWTPPGALHQSLPTFSGTFSGTLLNLTWLCTEASWNLLRKLLRNPVEPDLALHQSLPDFLWNLLQNLLRNLVEPDLLCTKSGTLLNVTPAPAHTGAILGWRPP